MEEANEDIFETNIHLNSNEKLDSKKLQKNYLLSCFIEDNIFNITAKDDNEVFLVQFRMPDWAQREEKEFTKRINTFPLLKNTIKEAFEIGKLVLYRLDSFSLMMTLYYINIFKEEKISFELHKQLEDKEEEKKLIGQFFAESKPIDELYNLDYKAELIGYNTNFEDYGDRNIIRMRVKNTGRCTWDRKITSFKCVPEFSSLLCNECFLEEDVYPDNETEVELEFMKGDPDNMEPPYFTFLHLHVYDENYKPMLVLDFNESFKDEEDKAIFKKNNINDEEEKKIKKKDKNKKENKDDNIINMVDGKSNVIFNNVKINISFNVENNNKIICVDVNDNKVKFNVDKNQVKFLNNEKNKIHVENKKPINKIKKIKETKEEKNSIIDNSKDNDSNGRSSIVDRIKIFDFKK